VVVSALPVIPLTVGASRIVAGKAVPHLMGDPSLSPDAERAYRLSLTELALEALTRQVDGPTLVTPAR
jgi:glycine reductase